VIVAGCILLGATMAGCAAALLGGGSRTARGASVAVSATGSPQQRAAADATAMLRAFAPPPGARRLTRPPDPLLASPTTILGSSSLVERTQWWLAVGQPQPLLAWEQERLPGWLRAGDMDFGPPSWDREWDVTSLPSGLNGADLVVKVASVGRGQVDAQVSWQPARSSAELVPPAATVVTITELPSPDPRAKRPPVPVTITAPAVVRRLAALVNSMPVSTFGNGFCPAPMGYALRLTFSARPGGSSLGTAEGPGDCGLIQFTGATGKQAPLTPPGQFLQDVFTAAGLHWPAT
jgi:hypothetical protein